MLRRKRWKTFITLLFLTLSTQEHVFAIVIAILLGQLIYLKKSEVKNSYRLNRLSVSIISIVISLAYHYLAKSYILSFPIDPEFVDVYKASNVFKIIGYKGNLLLLPVYIILNSGSTLKALIFDVYHKFLYFIFLFAPLLSLPLMNRFILVSILLFLPFFLSNYRAYYMVEHYFRGNII
ncbi:putative membrane protein (DUF2079) [Thaumarchaeota archaeon SCGC AB-539-E09]|nr:putative membrane protein (DUF2079) [Thaumarchaeota archaeon SCGC AB-539-E09]